MAEHRPFPPSPRRRAQARRAGLSAASPYLAGAAAGAALLVALAAAGRALAGDLGAALAAACAGQPVLRPAALPHRLLDTALPLLGAAAIAAILVHLAQTRALWLPRRPVPGAPTLPAGPSARSRRAGGELAAGAVIAGVAFAWSWLSAPRIAALVSLSPFGPAGAAATPSQLLAAAAALLANLAAALLVAWLLLGVLDALARHAALSRALAMTSTEKREDDRLAGADPRWRARRAAILRGPGATDAIAGSAVLVLGDGAAVAIAWDPVRRPVPVRTATGHGPRATQLLGLARRHQLPVHRDPALAAALAVGDGPVPEPHWPRLAEIVAATRRRDRRNGRGPAP